MGLKPIKKMGLKTILQAILAFISSIWRKTTDEVKIITPIAINIVNAVKSVNESFIGDVIEGVLKIAIPGDSEDKIIIQIRARLKEVLPKLILQLNLVDSIANISDTDEQLKAILGVINIAEDEKKRIFYHSLCSLIINSLADGKLTWSESVLIAEYYYTEVYKS